MAARRSGTASRVDFSRCPRAAAQSTGGRATTSHASVHRRREHPRGRLVRCPVGRLSAGARHTRTDGTLGCPSGGRGPSRFRAGDWIGEPVLPYRGGALGELPWVFRIGDDYAFVGEGSVANRSPELLVLVLDGCAPDRGDVISDPPISVSEEATRRADVHVRILDRTLWRISERTAIETESGDCVISPSSGQAAEDEYRLSGRRFHGFESAWPLFRGPAGTPPGPSRTACRAVPAGEVEWRQTGDDWRSRPTGFGLWEVRHLRAGELRHFGRVGILPERFDCAIKPGSDMKQGHLLLTGGVSVRVAGHDPEAVVTARTEGDAVRVRWPLRMKSRPRRA